MKRVLVTGSTGFIGQHCIQPLINAGYEVYACYHKTAYIKDIPNVQWIKIDLMDMNDVESVLKELKPTHLLHLAWCVNPKTYLHTEENIVWLEKSISLVRIFIENGGKRVITAGTCFEYDLSHGCLEEDSSPLDADTLYAACKISLYNICKVMCGSMGVEYCHGRIFYIYGTGESKERVVPYVINSLLNGDKAEVSQGKQIRDYMYVDDVSKSFVQLLNSDATGAYNIGSGQGKSLKSIFDCIATVLDKTNSVCYGKFVPANKEILRICADTRKFARDVGSIRQTPLTKGIEETIEWWKRQ